MWLFCRVSITGDSSHTPPLRATIRPYRCARPAPRATPLSLYTLHSESVYVCAATQHACPARYTPLRTHHAAIMPHIYAIMLRDVHTATTRSNRCPARTASTACRARARSLASSLADHATVRHRSARPTAVGLSLPPDLDDRSRPGGV